MEKSIYSDNVNAKAELLFSLLFRKGTEYLGKDELVDLIKPVLYNLELESKEIGKNKVLSHFANEIESFK